eukprot:2036208-Prymnesium_polylepis.1
MRLSASNARLNAGGSVPREDARRDSMRTARHECVHGATHSMCTGTPQHAWTTRYSTRGTGALQQRDRRRLAAPLELLAQRLVVRVEDEVLVHRRTRLPTTHSGGVSRPVSPGADTPRSLHRARDMRAVRARDMRAVCRAVCALCVRARKGWG